MRSKKIGIITETGLRSRLQNKVTETFSFQSPVFVGSKPGFLTGIWIRAGTWTGRSRLPENPRETEIPTQGLK